MKRLFLFLASVILALSASAQTLSNIAVSPHGNVILVGSGLPVTATCTYSDLSTDDCTKAGGVTWSTPTLAMTISATTGGTITANWAAAGTGFDPNSITDYPDGAQTAIGFVYGAAGGMRDYAQFLAQSSADTFSLFYTPNPNEYQNPLTEAQLPINVSVGAIVTVGVGFGKNLSGPTANPFSSFCNYASSNTAVATVTRYGLATAVAPGSATITCNPAGNGKYQEQTDGYNSTDSFTFNVVAPTITSRTWYVMPGGGTPFVSSSQTPFGQCNGLTHAVYPGLSAIRWLPNMVVTTGEVIADNAGNYETATVGGTTGNTHYPTWGATTSDGTVTWTKGAVYLTDQSCAMGNMRDLWMDGVSGNEDNWMIGGGDTVKVDQITGGYNLGLDALFSGFGGAGVFPANCGNPDCYMTTIPSGTAAHHTVIEGSNFASCHNDSAKTRLNVTWAAKNALNVKGSQFVDISCFEITDDSQCANSGNFTNACNNASSNYGVNGITESALTSFVTFTDIFIHGMAGEAINGASGGSLVMNYMHFRGNVAGSIDMDDAPLGMGNISMSGGLTLNNSITEFTGCVEEYPVVHNYPFIECRDSELNNGAPDGLGTGNTAGAWSFDHDKWFANYQDGLDLLHSGLQSLSVTNSISIANDGQAFKVGSAANVLFQNNIDIENCNRLGFPFGDEPIQAVVPGATLCRAGGGWFVAQFMPYGTYVVTDNTFVGYGDVALGYSCAAGGDDCSSANTALKNNVLLGYSDTGYNDNSQSAMLCPVRHSSCNANPTLFPANQGWAIRSNNQFAGTRACPQTLLTGETCTGSNTLFFVNQPASPITDETAMDNYNIYPKSGSPLIGAGVSFTGIPATDFYGTPTLSPPVIGAANFVPPVLNTITVTPNPGAVFVGATLPMAAGCLYNDGTTTPCTVVWSDTAAHSSIGSSTGVVTGVTAGVDTITATLSTVTGTATVTIATPPPFQPIRGLSYQGRLR
jgi:hypothetical protein